MRIATILLVSRTGYLERVLESLKNQTQKIESLIVVFDGSDADFIQVRNKVVEFGDDVLCVKSLNTVPAAAISDRREHIANNHNQITGMLGDFDWIFSIEDDGVLPTTALERLINVAHHFDNVGMVTGVELGRWGVPYVGAWKVDDFLNPTKVTSLESRVGWDGYEEIDGCGLYCALIRADLYKAHHFHSVNGLGPDVNLGLANRMKGYKNYIDWGVPVIHLTSRAGVEIEIPATDNTYIVTLTLMGKIWHQAKFMTNPSGQTQS